MCPGKLEFEEAGSSTSWSFLFPLLLISNDSFSTFLSPRWRSHPQSCLGGEGVRAGGHTQPGHTLSVAPKREYRQGDQLSRLFQDAEVPVLQTGNSQAPWDTLVTLSSPYSHAGKNKSITTATTAAKGPVTLSPKTASHWDSASLCRGESRVTLEHLVCTWQSRRTEGLSEITEQAGLEQLHALPGGLSAATCSAVGRKNGNLLVSRSRWEQDSRTGGGDPSGSFEECSLLQEVF